MIRQDGICRTIVKIIRLGRLRFVAAGFLLYTAGALLAAISIAKLDMLKYLLGYSILFTAQLSVSYSNDYFDFEADKLNKPRVFSGGSGILQENPGLRNFSRWFSVSLMVLSVLLSFIFVRIFSFSLIFVLFVMTVNLLGWFYSAPPVKFSYRGLGEVIILTIIGFVLPGSGYFMIKESIDRPFYIFMAIFEIYGLYFILNVQIPDIEADILAKKKTVASYLGSKFSFVLTGFLALIGTSYLLAIPIFNALPSTINFRLIGLVSMVPLITGFMGCVLQTKFRRQVFIFTNLNVLSLAVLLSFVDCYFLFLLLVNGK